MGVFSKLKGIFYDEVDVDEEDEEEVKVKVAPKKREEPRIKKVEVVEEDEELDIPQIVEEKPIKEEITRSEKEENTFSERDLFRSERTFNFTEFDEEELPPRKSVLDTIDNKYESKREEYLKAPEQPKVFKPTPIISPIYGILDKDYKREDVQAKPTSVNVIDSKVATYDSVRRKAYGTLEDDLEDTLNSMNNRITPSDINEGISDIDKEVEELNDKTQKIEDLISRIEESTNEIDKNMSIGDLEETVKLDHFDDDDDDDDKTMTDATLEHDLFNLIDSMYDDKE